jgi:hypothetical protein
MEWAICGSAVIHYLPALIHPNDAQIENALRNSFFLKLFCIHQSFIRVYSARYPALTVRGNTPHRSGFSGYPSRPENDSQPPGYIRFISSIRKTQKKGDLWRLARISHTVHLFHADAIGSATSLKPGISAFWSFAGRFSFSDSIEKIRRYDEN